MRSSMLTSYFFFTHATGNTYSTALLIGEKCAVLTGEDLGYSGSALDMKVPEYNAPGEVKLPLRL